MRPLNFDRIARPYRWLEYLTFGKALERCRFYYLPRLAGARRALVFGDGDGRFSAKWLANNPDACADIVDISPKMLQILRKKLPKNAQKRVLLHQSDARTFHPERKNYDLAVTHFFLDCLQTSEIAALLDRVCPCLSPNAAWIVSEFAVPSSQPAGFAASLIVATLYGAFRLLTGLRMTALPDYASPFQQHGFALVEEKKWLRGLLVSQIWQYRPCAPKQPDGNQAPHTQ